MITQESLINEYGEAKREEQRLQEELKNLAAGSVQQKTINGKEYYYLAFRKDGKVVTQYIKADDLDRMLDETMRRRNINQAMKQLREEVRLIEKALGRENANRRHIENSVKKVAEENPDLGISRVTLFGSRATKHFRDDSDVDLLVEYDQPRVSLFKQAGLQTKLRDELGLDVDLVHAPLTDNTMLTIQNERVVYSRT